MICGPAAMRWRRPPRPRTLAAALTLLLSLLAVVAVVVAYEVWRGESSPLGLPREEHPVDRGGGSGVTGDAAGLGNSLAAAGGSQGEEGGDKVIQGVEGGDKVIQGVESRDKDVEDVDKVNQGREGENKVNQTEDGEDKVNQRGEEGHPLLVPSPGPFPYIIDPTDKCPSGGEAAPPFLVLLITVEAHQVDRRDAIRRTWADESNPRLPAAQQRIVRLFLLGTKRKGEPGRTQQQRSLALESRVHGDIVQQDFVDTYDNLTLKTLMGLNWAARRCPHARFVMKADSDVFVNTERLVDKLLRLTPAQSKNYFTGHVERGSVPKRYNSKWSVSWEDYPGRVYPNYVSGDYVFSGELAAAIYGASGSVPYFRFEDVYVGMCLARLGVAPAASPPRQFNKQLVPWSLDAYRRLVTSHGVSPDDMLWIWSRLHPSVP